MSEIKISSASLLQFCVDCFERVGLSPADGRLTAESLIFANLRGVDSHGILRLKVYTQRLRAGGFKARAKPERVSESDSTAVLDAGQGVGQIAGVAAMDLALAKAQNAGTAWVSVRNSNHF